MLRVAGGTMALPTVYGLAASLSLAVFGSGLCSCLVVRLTDRVNAMVLRLERFSDGSARGGGRVGETGRSKQRPYTVPNRVTVL